MARTKQSAKRAYGKSSKTKTTMVSKAAARKTAPAVEGAKRAHRFRPGTVALREIKKY